MCFKTMADIGQVEFSNRCISWLCVLLVPCLSTSVPNVSLPVLESSTQWTRLLLQPWWHRRHLWPFWHFACVMGLFLTAYVFPFFNSKIMVLCSSTVCSLYVGVAQVKLFQNKHFTFMWMPHVMYCDGLVYVLFICGLWKLFLACPIQGDFKLQSCKLTYFHTWVICYEHVIQIFWNLP